MWQVLDKEFFYFLYENLFWHSIKFVFFLLLSNMGWDDIGAGLFVCVLLAFFVPRRNSKDTRIKWTLVDVIFLLDRSDMLLRTLSGWHFKFHGNSSFKVIDFVVILSLPWLFCFFFLFFDIYLSLSRNGFLNSSYFDVLDLYKCTNILFYNAYVTR